MVVVNKIIHRFVRDRVDYEPGGSLYNQIIPYNTQAYSYKLKENGNPNNPDDYIIAYVLGTGGSTYFEIANGNGKDIEGVAVPALSKELFVTPRDQIKIVQITLFPGFWDENNIQTVEDIPDLTESSIVILTPYPNTALMYANANIVCIAQSDNTLRFKCTTLPEDEILVNVLIQ